MQVLIESLIPIIAILAIFSIPLAAIYTSYKLKMEKLKQEGSGTTQEDLKELEYQIRELKATQALMKEALSTVQKEQDELPIRLELTEYEKEQIKLDQENKNFY